MPSRILRLAVWIAIATASAGAAAAADLFEPIPPGASAAGEPEVSGPELLRRRPALARPDRLGEDANAAPEGIGLNLFPGADFTFRPETLVRRSDSSRTWFGALEGLPAASAAFSVHEGALAGRVDFPGGAYYEITSAPDGSAVISEYDSGQLGPGGNCVVAPPALPFPPLAAGPSAASVPAAQSSAGDAALDGDDGTVHDLLVLYTSALQTANGGAAGVAAALNLAIDWSNQAYALSQIPLTVRLVHSALTPYTESGNRQTDLNRLGALGDGFLEEIITLIPAHKADTVCLVTNTNYGGVANLSGPFAVVGRLTYVPTFTHELGHNQGACHARGNGGGCEFGGQYSYSWGHQFTGNSLTYWGTVMAYDGTRIQLFSNPDVLYDGVATGVPIGTPGEANNAQTLIDFMPTLANWRLSSESGWFTVTNPEDILWEGPVGGPFTASGDVSYTLSNTSGAGLPWTAVSDQSWIEPDNAGGTIPNNGSAAVNAALTEGAAFLSAGIYTANIKFQSTLPGVSRKRKHILLAGQTPVSFADAALEAIVRDQIGRPSGNLYPFHLAALETLPAANSGIASLDGLQSCANLRDIDLAGNSLSSVAPLAGLASPQQILLAGNPLTDLTGLSGKPNLLVLDISSTGAADLSPLAGAVKLNNLLASGNAISSLSPLSGLTSLVYLEAANNQIQDISPLAGLSSLYYLDLSGNQIADVSPLANHAELLILNLAGNEISSVAGLTGLPLLNSLSLGDNPFADASPLGALPAIQYLQLAGTSVSSLAFAQGMANLQNLSAEGSLISSLAPLVLNPDFGAGDFVNILGNPLDCGTVWNDIPALEARGVTVIHDAVCPTPTPSATPAPTGTPTATPTPSATASATSTPAPTATAFASPTATPTASATSTATSTPTATPSSTPTPTASATATASPSATSTPTSSPNPTATPSPTPSVSATASPSPTVTPTPLELLSPAEEASGNFGISLAGTADATGDGLGDVIVGAYLEDPGTSPSGAGRVHVYDGSTGQLWRTLISPSETADGNFGRNVQGIADLDGDGLNEILVGAWQEASPGSPAKSGRFHAYSGAAGWLLGSLGSPFPEADGRFGARVSGGGDVNGDVKQEIFIGAPYEDASATADSGRAYIVSGATGAYLRILASPNPQPSGLFGFFIAGLYDLTGDGRGDLVVGAHQEEGPGAPADSGRAYAFNGSTGALLYTLDSPTARAGGHFGRNLARLFDANYDGRLDIAVGAPRESAGAQPPTAGRVHIYSGVDGARIRTFISPNPADNGVFGWCVQSLPDVNGDGRGELLVGAPQEDPGGVDQAGRAYLFSANGVLIQTFVSPNPEPFGFFGVFVHGVQDVNGDGKWEVAIGARQEDPGTSPDNAGRVYLFKSPAY